MASPSSCIDVPGLAVGGEHDAAGTPYDRVGVADPWPAAVLSPQRDLLLGAAMSPAAEVDAVGLGFGQQPFECRSDVGVDADAPHHVRGTTDCRVIRVRSASVARRTAATASASTPPSWSSLGRGRRQVGPDPLGQADLLELGPVELVERAGCAVGRDLRHRPPRPRPRTRSCRRAFSAASSSSATRSSRSALARSMTSAFSADSRSWVTMTFMAAICGGRM